MKKNTELTSVMKKTVIGTGIVGGIVGLSIVATPQTAMAAELPEEQAVNATVTQESITTQATEVSAEDLAAANDVIASSASSISDQQPTEDVQTDMVLDEIETPTTSMVDVEQDIEQPVQVSDTTITEAPAELENTDTENVTTDMPDSQIQETINTVPTVDSEENTSDEIADKAPIMTEDKNENIENTDLQSDINGEKANPQNSELADSINTAENKIESGENEMIVDANVQPTAQVDEQVQQAQDNTQAFFTAAQQVADNYDTGLTQKDIVDLYNKYVAPYHDAAQENDLFALVEATYNADGSLSAESQQAAVALINFFRALCGLGEVTINEDYNHYAQAGADYLADNNLGLDHNAASGVPGAEDANQGLTHSNLAQGYSGADVFDLLMSFIGDTDGYNEGSLGHRRWILDSNLKSVGFGVAKNDSSLYLAVYVMSGSLQPNEANNMWPSDGFFPIEALLATHTSTNDAFHISISSDYKVTNPADIKVTITKDDGTSKELEYTNNINNVIYDWFTYSGSGYGSGSAIIFMPDYSWINPNWNEFQSFDELIKGFAGHSLTITITGLKDASGNDATINYTINFFSLQQAIAEQAADREAAQNVTDQINGIKPTDQLTWEDYDSVKGVETAYNNLTTSQKEYVSDENVQKLNEAVEKVTQLYESHEADEKAATAVENAINQIPDSVTLEDETTVTSARTLYDQLTQDQKNLVDNYQKLTDAETTIAQLKQELAENQAAAQKVTDMINALPSTDALTLDDKTDVEAAREAYNALNEKAKAMVSDQNVSKLTAAESRIVQLEKEAADQAAAQTVIDQINALPSVDAITIDDEGVISDARAAYDGLTDDQKAIVDASGATTTLQNAETRLAEVKLQHMQDEEAVKTVTDAINALPATDALQLSDEAAVNNAANLYNALTETQKGMMDASVVQKLTDAQDQMQALIEQHKIDVEAAQAVTDQINALPEIIDRSSMDAVNNANDAYNALTDTQKALVEESTKARLDAAVQVVSNIQAADAVTEQINALPDVDKLTLDNRDAVQAADDAFAALTEDQKQYVDESTKEKLVNALHQIDVLDAENVTSIIDALPNVDEITLDDKDAVQAASDAYDALSSEAKAMIDQATYEKLDQAEDKITDLEDAQAADQVETVIGSLKDAADLTLDDQSAVYAARDMYNALNDNAKSKVDPAMVQKLADLVSRMDQLVADNEAAQNPGDGGQTGGDTTGSGNNGTNANGQGGTVDTTNGSDNGPNTGITDNNTTGILATILALFGIGGAGLFARKRRKAEK